MPLWQIVNLSARINSEISFGGDSCFTEREIPIQPGDHCAVSTWPCIAKCSVKPFAILSISTLLGYTVLNSLLSQWSNIFLTLLLACLHKLQCVVLSCAKYYIKPNCRIPSQGRPTRLTDASCLRPCSKCPVSQRSIIRCGQQVSLPREQVVHQTMK